MDRKYRKIVLLLPISMIYLMLIGGGFYVVLKESLGIIPNLGFTDLTFTYFSDILEQDDMMISMMYSVGIATISTILSMFIGTFIAYRMTQSKHENMKSLIQHLFRFGMILPYLYMVFIVMLFFSQSGLVSRLLNVIGLVNNTQSFPNLIYGSMGIVLVYVLKGIPFVIFLVINVMNKISRDYEGVARTLGSNSIQILKRIYLPLSKDTIVWAGMVLYAYDLGSFEVPYILSQIKHQSFSVKLYSSYLSPSLSSVPETMAMTIILFGVGIVTVILFALVTRTLIGRASR
jgi:putative spermidine/putrescine transport system permease protein